MIVLYSTYLQFPGGNPAANYPIPVSPMGSNQLALIFTDQTGTVAADNPVITDSYGQVVFWAAPGNYLASLAGEYFGVPVDESITESVWPDLWIHEQSTPSTVWTVNHHFGVQPGTEIILSGEESEAVVSHPTNETTVFTFGIPTVGFAYLRR